MTTYHFFAIVVALQLADIYTTLLALKRGAVEGNPIVRSLMDAIGVKEALLLAKIAALIPLWVYRDLTPEWVWMALVALYGVVCLPSIMVLSENTICIPE